MRGRRQIHGRPPHAPCRRNGIRRALEAAALTSASRPRTPSLTRAAGFVPCLRVVPAADSDSVGRPPLVAPPPAHPVRHSRARAVRRMHRSRRGANAPSTTPPWRQRVTIEGHYDNAVGTSDAASQGTIRAELLKSRPALRPGEVLEFVPGVIVTQHSGDGKANQYFLRGFNLDHGTDFATSVDGMPVNMPTPRPRPGLHRPELPDPRAGPAHRVPQGAVLRDRTATSPPPARPTSSTAHASTRRSALLTLGENGYRRGVLGGSIDAGRRQHAARRVRGAAQRRPLDAAREPAQGQRRGHLAGGTQAQRLERQPDGLRRAAGAPPTRCRSG